MEQEPNALDLAARALAHRDRSRRELDDRLARAGVDDETRADALDTLERVGYVDDGRFAASRAEALAGRGYGDAYIRHDLESHGVAGETVEQALGRLDPEAGRARALAARLGASPQTAGRLARKGFSADSVEAALGHEIAGSEPGL